MHFSDEELVKGCIKRDEQSREALYQKYSRIVYAQILRYAHNKEDAEDILQDTFLNVFTKIKQCQKTDNLLSWITTIAIREAIKHYRIKKRHIPKENIMSISTFKDASIKDESMVWKDELGYQILLKQIQQLPDKYRTVINLCEIDGYSIKQASEKLSCSQNLVRLWLFRAKQMLREKIKELQQKGTI